MAQQPTRAQQRALSAACSVAMRFAWAVSGRDQAQVQAICDGLSRAELAALAVVLAAAADGHRLLVVAKTAPGDGERHTEGDGVAA